jgi:hypothetical protein
MLCSLEDVMVGSTGSQPSISVKRRGSKRHAAEADDWGDTGARRRDHEDRDDRSLDPAGDGKAPVLAQ